MGYRERRMQYEQQLRELRTRGFNYMLLRKGILEFGVWLGTVMMALTLVREYLATGLSGQPSSQALSAASLQPSWGVPSLAC